MNKTFIRLLEERRLKPSFLDPKYNDLTDSFTLHDMDQAVSRIRRAAKNQERILIYGDYDVDGVAASTVMEQSLRLAGVKPENIGVMLPDRFADGYGMSPKLIAHAKNQGATLIITVDCGSRNFDIVNELNTLKIDTIITDHHETEDEVPEAVAVINPHRKDYPTEKLQNLAGVGVAFKVAEALVSKNLIKKGQEKWLLDLVLLGTICDSMTLIGENRILGYYGLKVLEKTRRPGLKELMTSARVKNLTSESIGFQIGPRLNAAGRLGSAYLSLDLLRAESPLTAAPLVKELEQLNQRRRTEQLAAMKEIKERGISSDPVIIESGKWHEGIIGIVAGHLVEDYHKPAFVLTDVGNGVFKGSARSFGDFNLSDALTAVKDIIIKGGGHAAAAGVSVEQKNLYQFRERINEYYRSLHLPDQTQFRIQHADLDLTDFSDLTPELLSDLKSLEPFGPGNEEPIFKLKGAHILNVIRMGADRNHLRIDLQDKTGKNLKLIAFYAPEDWLNLDPQFDHIEPLVRLVENDFNGIKTLEARILGLGLDNE